jgi:hypothetical protein
MSWRLRGQIVTAPVPLKGFTEQPRLQRQRRAMIRPEFADRDPALPKVLLIAQVLVGQHEQT